MENLRKQTLSLHLHLFDASITYAAFNNYTQRFYVLIKFNKYLAEFFYFDNQITPMQRALVGLFCSQNISIWLDGL